MPKIVIRKASKNIRDVELLLQGGVTGGAGLPALGIYGLDGLTLKFLSPSVTTVTLDTNPEGAQQLLSPKEIKTQIEAAVATVRVSFIADGNTNRMSIVEVTPTSGVSLDKTGTANAALGFTTAVNTVGVKYGLAAAPRLVQMLPTDDGFLVITEE
jgi:hypothetical protein